jgi:signal transduction histidine kinase
MPAVPTQLERATASGGETGALVRKLDWSLTPLGPISSWPPALQAAVSTCLSTGFPMVINWGSELIQIYNDAAIPVFGKRHPRAMGGPARTNFPEFWEFTRVEAIQKYIFETALPFRSEDERLLVNRAGFLEETYHTFSLSPILDDAGTVLGVLNTYVETTSRVLTERRMATLRRLAEHEVRARSPNEACSEAIAALSINPYDLRFVLIYLVDRDGAAATLAGVTGIAPESPAAPRTLAMHPAGEAFAWPLESVLRLGGSELVEDLPSRVDLGQRSGRTSPPRDAIVLPLVRSTGAAPAGVVVVGLSPRLRLDDAYKGFLKLVASQIAAGIGSAEAYHEARERAEHLAEIDRAKSVFYSNISHEFRTPLTLMLGPVDDLLHEAEGNLTPAQREKLVALRRNALRLLRLVSGLLDLARVEGGSLQLEREPTDLASLTREIASAFESSMTLAGLRFVVDCPPLPRRVRVDRGVWETIVLNLVSNALKYTPRGEVTVTLRDAGERVRLAVRDTGVGIAPSVLPHVFERFYRSRGSEGRSIEGTGIGLSLVREFARALGGDVAVSSSPGQGSTFTVEIPLDSEAPAEPAGVGERAAAPGAGLPSFVQEAESWIEHAQSPRAPPQSADRSLSRPGILVVEDNPDMRQYLGHVLSRDYEVDTVADGAAALKSAVASPPDLVLSDVLMPGMDGLALVRALRSDPRTQSLPAILLTARAGEDAALEGLGSGADDYIVKPFSSRELRARIRTHLELARMRRAAAESAMKDTFIGIASHELRTPLMTMKLQLELLAREAKESVTSPGGRLEVLRRSIVRMEGLVDELLTVSALKSGTLALQREREDLVAICRSAAEEQMLIAQRRVSLELPTQPTFALVDAHRVRQVVSNLLSNALKYSPPDRPVALLLRRTEADAIIAVRDEGPGIPADALPHLFDRFYRVPGIEVRSGSRTGLGLGLFLSAAIVSRHGGHIDVDTQPGRGSTFSVRLPLSAPAPTTPAGPPP